MHVAVRIEQTEQQRTDTVAVLVDDEPASLSRADGRGAFAAFFQVATASARRFCA